MKRYLWIMQAFIVVMAVLCCFTALADESGTCGEGLTWSFSPNDGILAIRGNGAMNDYSLFEAPWYSMRETITTVEIDPYVTSIGSYAFADCINLTCVICTGTIMKESDPYFTNEYRINSITAIGDHAFDNCTGLTCIKFYGTEEEWNAVTCGCSNEYLNNSEILFICNCGFLDDNLTWEKEYSGKLTIGGTGPMRNFDKYYRYDIPWSSSGFNIPITTVEIGNGGRNRGRFSVLTKKQRTIYNVRGDTKCQEAQEQRETAGSIM